MDRKLHKQIPNTANTKKKKLHKKKTVSSQPPNQKNVFIAQKNPRKNTTGLNHALDTRQRSESMNYCEVPRPFL